MNKLIILCFILFFSISISHADECTPIVDSSVKGFIQAKEKYEAMSGKESNLAQVLEEITILRRRYEDCVVLAKSEKLKSSFLTMLKMNEMVE